jgi:aminoglycoside phosphotransferase family enzyme
MVALTDLPHRFTEEAPAHARQRQLVESLCRPGVLDSGAEPATLMETHISYVLLAGAYAYKIKKAVILQFLNFSTVAARRHDCHEELRLNRPLAPSIYLDVVEITGTVESPAIGGDGSVLEYALKMRRFRQDGLREAYEVGAQRYDGDIARDRGRRWSDSHQA